MMSENRDGAKAKVLTYLWGDIPMRSEPGCTAKP